MPLEGKQHWSPEGAAASAGLRRSAVREGCRVAIAGRRTDVLAQVAARGRGTHRLETHPVDVADRGSVETLFRWAGELLGKIDILVNSAGINTRRHRFTSWPPKTGTG